MSIVIRNTQLSDYPEIERLCRAVYPDSPPWGRGQIESHLKVFPEGQFVAVEVDDKTSQENAIVGMAASLIINWDEYDFDENWRDFTDAGWFTNHDPENGKTLYGAEVMVSPQHQGNGIGKKIYAAREALVRKKKLLRIRAGARLRRYGQYAPKMSPELYVMRVIKGEIYDPTLTFQLKRGFHVLSVVSGYLRFDPESLGYAAVIEWINDDIARPEDYRRGDPKFRIESPWVKAHE